MKFTDVLFALSLATLVFYGTYAAVLTLSDPQATYHLRALPGAAVYGALIAATALLAAVIALIVAAMKRTSNRAVQFAGGAVIAAMLAVAAVGILRISGVNSTILLNVMRRMPWLVGRWGLLVLLLLGAVTAFVAWRLRRFVAPAVYWIIFCFFPIALWNAVVLARHAWSAEVRPGWMRRAPSVPAPERRASDPHVVVLVFDEADFRLLFENPSLHLKELARLRNESLFATNAYPPSGYTKLSLPAILTGRILRNVKILGANDADLVFDDGTTANWSATATLFTRARQDGFSSAIVGWYHPYCRVLVGQLADCRFYELPTQGNAVSRSFAPAVLDLFRTTMETPNLSPFGQSLVVEKSVENHLGIVATAKSFLGKHNVVFVHFSIPHSPHIYDVRTRKLTLANSRFEGYAGNLLLMDATIGDIRRRLEQMGLWDRSSIILTSDHWQRMSSTVAGKRDHRVPFMVKLPGQREGAEYTRPFNNVVTAEIVPALLRGEVRTAEELAPWLDAHSIDHKPAEAEGFD